MYWILKLKPESRCSIYLCNHRWVKLTVLIYFPLDNLCNWPIMKGKFAGASLKRGYSCEHINAIFLFKNEKCIRSIYYGKPFYSLILSKFSTNIKDILPTNNFSKIKFLHFSSEKCLFFFVGNVCFCWKYLPIKTDKY